MADRSESSLCTRWTRSSFLRRDSLVLGPVRSSVFSGAASPRDGSSSPNLRTSRATGLRKISSVGQSTDRETQECGASRESRSHRGGDLRIALRPNLGRHGTRCRGFRKVSRGRRTGSNSAVGFGQLDRSRGSLFSNHFQTLGFVSRVVATRRDPCSMGATTSNLEPI